MHNIPDTQFLIKVALQLIPRPLILPLLAMPIHVTITGQALNLAGVQKLKGNNISGVYAFTPGCIPCKTHAGCTPVAPRVYTNVESWRTPEV